MTGQLQPDCSKCADLCCIAYAFDAGHGFGLDKVADDPCPNLADCSGCEIHDDLDAAGYSGCVQYNCYGAGVRVTQELFGGADWRDDAALIGPMCDALRQLAPLHNQAALLDQAQTLALPPEALAKLTELLSRALACDLAEAAAITREIERFVATLRCHLP